MDQRNYAVIGGSSGIGRTLVANLAADGHRVWAGSRSASGVEFEDGVSSFTWDAATGDLPGNVIPEDLQGLVYCPGTIKLAPVARLSPDRFVEDFQVNLIGAVRAVQACLPALKRSEHGASVVLFSTVILSNEWADPEILPLSGGVSAGGRRLLDQRPGTARRWRHVGVADV